MEHALHVKSEWDWTESRRYGRSAMLKGRRSIVWNELFFRQDKFLTSVLAVIRQRGFVIEKILLTHGHFDHMGAAAQIQDALSIPICMHERGREYTENPRWNLSEGCGLYIKLDDVSYLPDGSRIALERNPVFSLTMHYVPGHTTDSVFYYSAKDNVAFVGDSIFKNSFGLTHFPGGDEQTLMQSITQRILKLPK